MREFVNTESRIDKVIRRIESLFGPTCSEWQANLIARCITAGVAIVSALVFLVAVANGLLCVYAGMESTVTTIEFAASIVCLILMLCAGFVFRCLYLRGYEMREEPVTEVEVSDRFGTTWQALYPDKSMVLLSEENSNDSEAIAARKANAEVAAMYANEFFFNAMVNPRTVFSRVSEHLSPGLKMIDCCTDYEVCPPEQRGVRICGINDYAARSSAGVSCFLTVPISFLNRGDFAVRQDASNAGNIRFPRVKQSEISEQVARIIESYRFSNGHVLRTNYTWLSQLRPELIDYLSSQDDWSGDQTKFPDIIKRVYRLMEENAQTCSDDKRFAQNMYYLLAGFRNVVPVCVSLHVVALPSKLEIDGQSSLPGNADSFPKRVFNLRYEQKVEMLRKHADTIPNNSNSKFVRLVNRVIDRLGSRNSTVYYNLARAGRSTSYHLYLDGPEGTYYSRGSLVWDKKSAIRSRSRIRADCVQMQRRYGQRHAHLYIRNGHCMSEIAFMFRYRKAPLDTSHIMFVAAFLCTAVLAVCALTSIGALKDAVTTASGFSGFSVPAMVLAVATAAGPWIYNRASNGRGDSLGVEISVLVLTVCSAAGIVLFFAVVRMDGDEIALAVRAWSIVLAIMAVNTAYSASMSLMHSVLYQRLLDSTEQRGLKSEVIKPSASTAQFSEERQSGSGDSVRLDTPHGRYVRNAYGIWCVTLRQFRINSQTISGEELEFVKTHEV